MTANNQLIKGTNLMNIILLNEALKHGGRTDLIEHCWCQDGNLMFYARFNRVFVDLANISIEFQPFNSFTFDPTLESQETIPSEYRLDNETIISTVIFIAQSILSRTTTFDGYEFKTSTDSYEEKLERLGELQELFLEWDPKNYVPAENNIHIKLTKKDC